MSEFLSQYFFSGYTLFNTLIYGIILIIAIYFIIKLFKHYNINPIDLIFPLIPFIFLGSGIRALVDNGVYPYSWFLITPGIYFIIGGIAIISLILGKYLEKKRSIEKRNIDYKKFIFIVGMILAIINFINIPKISGIAIFQILIIWGVITGIIAVIGIFWNNFEIFKVLNVFKFFKVFGNKINLSVLSAHIFDATTTFIAVDFYGYWEQHVIPNSIYTLSGTAITMFPLKIIVISAVLYVIDKYIDDELIAGTLKLAIFILGLAPGIRNFLTLAIGIA
ncbi:MAG: DUF63 family protein [Methanobrevibacter sp.]|nr:DUF63 family protein [Methanobrevibacter sp.]